MCLLRTRNKASRHNCTWRMKFDSERFGYMLMRRRSRMTIRTFSASLAVILLGVPEIVGALTHLYCSRQNLRTRLPAHMRVGPWTSSRWLRRHNNSTLKISHWYINNTCMWYINFIAVKLRSEFEPYLIFMCKSNKVWLNEGEIIRNNYVLSKKNS